MKNIFLITLLILLITGCQAAPEPTATPIPPTPSPEPTATPEPILLGGGFRYSPYGPWFDPGPEYWGDVGQQMAAKFPDAVPETIWIVSEQGAKGTVLSFPGSTEKPYIFFNSEDKNEASLTHFDELGFKVWLQLEPGEADVEELIHIVLDRYSHHPSVVGVGIDVEWYGSIGIPEGIPVTDEVAETWLSIVKEYNPEYRIFLKHWLAEVMPPTVREDILFVNDRQEYESKEEMIAWFDEWGEMFEPYPVAYQFGYMADKSWWDDLEDPPGEIGNEILANVPNTEGIYWVDFTIFDLFPPPRE